MESAWISAPYSVEQGRVEDRCVVACGVVDVHVHPTDYARLKERMRKDGIERAIVLASGPELYPGLDTQRVLAVCREDSSLIPAGTFNPAKLETPPRTFVVKLYPAYQGWRPGDYLELLAGVKAGVLMFHTGAKGSGPDYQAELGRPEALEAVVKALPEKTIIATHAGFPWIDDMAVLVERYDNLYADLAALNKPLERIRDSIPVDRILYGSDWPLEISSIKRVRDVFGADSFKVLRENALTVLSRRDR